jgi:hypothetical protein
VLLAGVETVRVVVVLVGEVIDDGVVALAEFGEGALLIPVKYISQSIVILASLEMRTSVRGVGCVRSIFARNNRVWGSSSGSASNRDGQRRRRFLFACTASNRRGTRKRDFLVFGVHPTRRSWSRLVHRA